MAKTYSFLFDSDTFNNAGEIGGIRRIEILGTLLKERERFFGHDSAVERALQSRQIGDFFEMKGYRFYEPISKTEDTNQDFIQRFAFSLAIVRRFVFSRETRIRILKEDFLQNVWSAIILKHERQGL